MNRDSRRVEDRRGEQRFSMSAPLTVLVGNRAIPAFTRDLSNRGVYFYLNLADSALIGSDFSFVVELPPEITLSTCCRIQCQGKVVRTEITSWHETGIAAEILHYSIQREPAA
jgi:hypothetical protein